MTYFSQSWLSEIAILTKGNTELGLACSSRGLVHCHRGGKHGSRHGSGEYLRVLHLDSRAAGSEKPQGLTWAFEIHKVTHFLQSDSS